jgi:hypothetical protein
MGGEVQAQAMTACAKLAAAGAATGAAPAFSTRYGLPETPQTVLQHILNALILRQALPCNVSSKCHPVMFRAFYDGPYGEGCLTAGAQHGSAWQMSLATSSNACSTPGF